MVLKISKRGKFAGCAGYPDCTTTMPLDKDGNVITLDLADQNCDKCGSSLVVRMGRRGPFVSCSAFPKCRNTRPLPKKEPKDEDESEQDEETASA